MQSTSPPRPLVRVFLLLVTFTVACSSDLTIEDLIERNTAALGGQDHLERLHSVQVVRNQNMITVTRRPYFHKVELFDDEGGLRYAEGINGYVAWEQTADEAVRRPVTGRPAQALWRVLQWPGPLTPLYRMAGRGHSLALLPDTVVEDTRYHQLLLTLSDGFERTYFVNSETYQIERARDYRRLHATDETVQNIEGVWGDFREVDGYLFPFYSEERNYETGERFYGSTLVGVRVNVEVPDGEFGLDGVSRPDMLRTLVRELDP